MLAIVDRDEGNRTSKRRRLASAGEEKLKATDQGSGVHKESADDADVSIMEPDSLLILSDGAGSPILTHALRFLTHEEVAQCEQTCKLLRKQATHIWKEMDEYLKTWLDEDVLPKKVKDAKKRVLMHHIASGLAIDSLLPEFSMKDNERSILDEDWEEQDYEVYVQLSKQGRIWVPRQSLQQMMT